MHLKQSYRGAVGSSIHTWPQFLSTGSKLEAEAGNYGLTDHHEDREGLVAARNICINMVQGFSSPSEDIDMMVGFR